MTCAVCGGVLKYRPDRGTYETLVGYGKGTCGFAHNDNCQIRIYECVGCNAQQQVSIIRRCESPTCDWTGKTECFCHLGKKVSEWP